MLLKFRDPGLGDSEGSDVVRGGSIMSVSREKDGLSEAKELSKSSS